MTKLGGLIGAALLIALVLYVGDRVDWLADIKSDFVATLVVTVAGVIGWLTGSRTAGRLTHRPGRDTATPAH